MSKKRSKGRSSGRGKGTGKSWDPRPSGGGGRGGSGGGGRGGQGNQSSSRSAQDGKRPSQDGPRGGGGKPGGRPNSDRARQAFRDRGGPGRPGDRLGDLGDRQGEPKERPFLAEARAQTAARLKEWLAQAEALRSAPRPSDTDSDGTPRLDTWQRHVFDALQNGDSVVVDAPTTAGKTRAVEAYFRANINNPTFRACYTTPVKSLSNDKLREFREMFGAENVGIATGDIKENLNAPIVVATLESYRNSLLGVEPDLGRTIAVFDEYHYLQDESRGSAWEEAMILTPRHCQVLLLSASVANAEQFVDWLTSLGEGRKCVLVRTEVRPVPLAPMVFYSGEWLVAESLPPSVFKNLDQRLMEIPLRQEVIAERAAKLVDIGLTPCIAYCGRRLSCETFAALLCRILPQMDEAASAKIGASLEASHNEFKGLSFMPPRLRHMLQVYGVAYHHSGLAAPARMAVEALVKNGLLRFTVATMGLSLGINFSVRSALITDYQRPGEQGFTQYGPSEVLQMLGRAGRRGRDAVGFSVWPSPEAYTKLAGARREPVTSRLRSDPTTFLGLVGRGFGLRAIENFYSKSFRRFQDRNVDLSLITKSRLQKKLGEELDLPCASPAAEVARFWREDPESKCGACPHRARCHPILEAKTAGSLSALHVHLHVIGALNADESLSSFGSIARYFPQAGGLLIAKKLADGEFEVENLTRLAELAGALALARFKEPGSDSRYHLPYTTSEIEEELERLYPYELFEEIYDPPFARRNYPVIREFNPAAGYMIREWINGMPWKDLTQNVTTELFGTGDMMSLLYRSATYLQSVVQADIVGLKDTARTLRGIMLREPLSYALEI